LIECEYMSTMGTTGDIMLASLSQYQTIDKGGVQAASSIHVAFLTDQSVFRFVYRVDGAPMWHSALTPFKGSQTQSPFVVLATASA
jgi:HK97 family phage major capsid protein